MATELDVDGGQSGIQAATRALVLDALRKGVGETLVKNTELRARLGISAGTAQRALDLLAERDALVTVSRGHLGRRIEHIDLGQGWQAAGLPAVRVTLSPAGSIEIDAIESALTEELERLGVPFTVQHRPGGVPRLNATAAGAHDITVVSAGTLRGLEASRGSVWDGPRRVLDEGSYYVPDRLIVLEPAEVASGARPIRRVAVDRGSFDHETLTTAEFGTSFEMVDVPFPDVPAYVMAGAVDAGIWHITRSAITPQQAGLVSRQLRSDDAVAVRGLLSRAALVGWSGRPEVAAVISALTLTHVDVNRARSLAAEDARERELIRTLQAIERAAR